MWRGICSFAVRKENKGMRLQSKEIQTIIQIAKDIYGETVQVYLFGSRLNDEKRGGDIDLLVRSTGEKKGVLARIRTGSTGSLEKRNTTDMTEKKIHRIILCLKRMLPSF